MQPITYTVIVPIFAFMLGILTGMISDLSFTVETFNNLLSGLSATITAAIAVWAANKWKDQTTFGSKAAALANYKKAFYLLNDAMFETITTSSWYLAVEKTPLGNYNLPDIDEKNRHELIKLEKQVETASLLWRRFQEAEAELKSVKEPIAGVNNLSSGFYQVYRGHLDPIEKKVRALRNEEEMRPLDLKKAYEIDQADRPNEIGKSGWDESTKRIQDRIQLLTM